jgi:hypothetical protein
MAAKRAAAEQRTLIEQARAAQNAANAQSGFNQALGVKDPAQTDSARQSAAVFEAAFAAEEEATAGLKAYQDELARLAGIFDPVTLSAQRMTGELAELNKAQQLGVNIAGGYTNAWNAIVEKYDEGAQAAKRAAAEQRALIEQARAAQNASNAQSGFNQVLGVKDPGQRKSARESASVFQEKIEDDEKLLAERKALEAEMNPLKTASDAYAASLTRVNRAVELGLISEAQAVVQRQRVTQGFERTKKAIEDYGHAGGQAAFAQRQFNVQMVQLFSSIQGGQPIMLALVQQLHQVFDVALATGTGFEVVGKAIKTAFGFLFSQIGLIVAAAAGLAALGIAAEISTRRLATMRNQLGGVRDDAAGSVQMAEAAARHLAATTSLGTNEARKAGGTILGAREFQGDQAQLEALVVAAQKLSLRLGEDLPASAERLKKGLQDPVALAKELADHGLKGMDQALVNAATRLQEAGKKAEAFDLVFHALQANVSGVTTSLSPLDEALKKLAQSFTSSWQGGKSFADVLGTAVTGVAAGAIDKITELVNTIKSAITWLDQNTPDWLKTAAKTAATWGAGNPLGPLSMLLPSTQVPDTYGAPSGQRVKIGGQGVGMFQIEPGAASDVGMTSAQRYDYGSNIVGGAKYFRQQYEATGSIDDATRAYNAGLKGAQEGKGGDYLAGVQKQNIANLPAQSRADIEQTFGTIFADLARTVKGPAIRDRLMQIAMQESGGQHYEPISAARTPGEGALTGRGASTQTAGGVTPSGAANVDVVNRAVELASGMGLVSPAAAKALGAVETLRLGLAKLKEENKQGTPEFALLTEAMRRAHLEVQEAIEPADKLTQSLDRQTSGETRIAAAYGKGYSEVARATAAVRAEEEARTLAAQGLGEYNDLVAKLTAKYLAPRECTAEDRAGPRGAGH